MTYSEIVYMCLDELKLSSDDSYFTKDHLLFLLSKYRAFLLKQRYSDIKKPIPESNYQVICLELQEIAPIDGGYCEGSNYLTSVLPVPPVMKIGSPRIYTDYYQGEIAFISRDRMKYVGYNKALQNFIYCSRHPNGHLYFTSCNPQFIYLQSIQMSAIFEDIIAATNLSCLDQSTCDIYDSIFPIEDSLVPPLIELVVKELRGPEYSPEDKDNNAEDDLSNVSMK